MTILNAYQIQALTSTISGGTTASIVASGDNNWLGLNETTGTPGFSFTFKFAGSILAAENFGHTYQLRHRSWYDGNIAHDVFLRFYNFNLST